MNKNIKRNKKLHKFLFPENCRRNQLSCAFVHDLEGKTVVRNMEGNHGKFFEARAIKISWVSDRGAKASNVLMTLDSFA